MTDSGLVTDAAADKAGVRGQSFFFFMSVAILGLVLFGFSKTFYLRAFFDQEVYLADEFMTPELYIHGSVMTAWFVLLAIQTLLIGRGAYGLHKVMGLFGAVLAVAVILSGIPVIAGFGPRLISAGLDADLVLPVISVLIWFDILALVAFAMLVASAVLLRRKGAWHKRLIMFASIAFILPATFRAVNGYAPDLPAMPVALVVSLALMAVMAVYDLRALRRLHPATLAGGVIVSLLTGLGFFIGASGAGQGFVSGLM